MGSSYARRENFPVAVVGLGCRFPGDATCPTEFWNLMKDGKGEYYKEGWTET